MIGHTQPRRIAARSVAERIAEELGSELGETVGYQVRFTDRTSKQSRVKVMTDGILLAELQRDRMLERYDTLIIDEAHERSLNVDFLLGYLKRLLPRRPDLKLIITSATIDPERFAEHFADARGRPAPIIEVSGRTYPVEVRYRPLLEESYDDEEGEPVLRDQTEAIEDAVTELVADTAGDILVFLPGEREIRDTADVLKRKAEGPRGFDIVPLFSRLSSAEQHRVFERHTRRRVVLATNVAETSLTVPGITGVIDTGLARISRWSSRTKVQRLPIEPVSQASAQQRSGRCGRIEAGVAIRLYSEEDFLATAGVHRAGDPAHLARERDPADDLARPRPGRAVPVRGPARRQGGAGRRTAAGGARCTGAERHREGPGSPAHRRRPQAGAAADRPPARPDDPGGRQARLPARGPGDHGRTVHPGPARASGGAAGAGRPAARPLPGPTVGLHGVAQPVAAPAREAEGDGIERVPADVPRGAPELPAGARVAGLRVPAAAGRQAGEAEAGRVRRAQQPRTRTASTRRCCQACCRTSACATGTGGTTWVPGGRGSRSSRARGCSSPSPTW